MQSNIHLRSGAQLIAQQLEAIGVRYVFGIPGPKSTVFSTRLRIPKSK